MQRTLAIIKTLIFTILVPGFVAGIVPAWLRNKPLALFDAVGFGGMILLAGGVLIYLRSAWDFAYTGLGTPAPVDPPKVLISHGLHRFLRNPMYLGVLLTILGEAALFHSFPTLVYGACFWLMAHAFVIFYEEPTLERKFGASYQLYRQTVPRWIPRFHLQRN